MTNVEFYEQQILKGSSLITFAERLQIQLLATILDKLQDIYEAESN